MKMQHSLRIVTVLVGVAGVLLPSLSFGEPTLTPNLESDISAPMTREQRVRASLNAFTLLDKDGDGFVTIAEAPEMYVTTRNNMILKDESGSQLWMSIVDKNRDQKVSRIEYVDFKDRSVTHSAPVEPAKPS